MKKARFYILAGWLIGTGLMLAAQVNYNMAHKAAFNSEGSDSAIEAAMLEHGFNVDANDREEPTAFEKVVALGRVIF